MGVDNDIAPLYGWSESGKKSYAEKIAFKTSRLSIASAYKYNAKKTPIILSAILIFSFIFIYKSY